MHATTFNPEAAQALVTDETGKQVDPFLYDRAWPDRGDDFGDALRAAAHPDGADSTTAAHIAADLVDRVGEDLAENRNLTSQRLAGMQDSIGQILADRIDDVHDGLNSNLSVSGVSGLDPTQAMFHERELAEAIRFGVGTEAGFNAMIDAELAHAKAEMAEWAKDENRTLTGAMGQAGVGLGFIVEAREDVMLERGEEMDARHNRLPNSSKPAPDWCRPKGSERPWVR